MLGFWILLALVILWVAALPSYPYSRGWGYWPGGVILALAILWVVLIYVGMVAFTLPWAPEVVDAK